MNGWYAQEYASSDIGNTPDPTYKCLKVDFNLPDSEDLLHLNAVETYVSQNDCQH